MILHYSNLTPAQQTNVIIELIGIYEDWEILNGRYEFHEDGFYLVEPEMLH